MKTFEYKIISGLNAESGIIAALEELSEKGWEMATSLKCDGSESYGYSYTFLLKRKINPS